MDFVSAKNIRQTRNSWAVVHALHQLGALVPLSLAGPFDQPLQHGVEVGLLLGADSITADFTVGDRLEIQCLNEFINRQFLRQV